MSHSRIGRQASTSALKTCCRCWRALPAGEFRRRERPGKDARDGRAGECRECYNAEQRRCRAKRRERDIIAFVQEANGTDRCNVRMLTAVYATMIRRFGGLDAFSTAWKRAIDEASQNRRFGLAMKSFQAIIDLSVVASDHDAHKQSGPKTVSDDELERAIRAEVLALIDEGLIDAD
jgi:hypothetical protein